MKDQQLAQQESRQQSRDQKREGQKRSDTPAARLPIQQWTQILRTGEGLLELPAPLLEQLAEAVGNSSLIELLRRGGGEGPRTCSPDTLDREGPEPDVNHIQTEPPMLVPFAGWPERCGPWSRPIRPDGIRDRG